MKLNHLVILITISSGIHLKGIDIGQGFVFENIDTTLQNSVVNNPTDYLLSSVIPDWTTSDIDTDNDGIPDESDPDDNNDGVPDVDDPQHPNFNDPDDTTDSDGDGIPDNTDDNYDNDTGTDSNSSSGQYDSDDDVPMLTQIYQRLNNLDQDDDHTNLSNIWDRQADLAGTIHQIDDPMAIQDDVNSLGLRLAQVADMEMSLRRIERDIKLTRGQYYEDNGTSTGEYATLKDIVDAINGKNNEQNTTAPIDFDNDYLASNELSTFQNMSNNVQETVNPSLATSGILDATANFTLKGEDVYFGVLDPSTNSGGSYLRKMDILPSRADLALFFKRAILIMVLAFYYFANWKLLFTTTDTLIKANESNTVSNYSLLGFNIGGTALKTIKFGIWATFLASVGWTTFVGLAEGGVSFDIDAALTNDASSGGGWSLSPFALMTSLLVKISSIADWALASVNLLLEFVPIPTIVSAITTYYMNQILIYGHVFAMNRAQRLAS